jgi:hypothetical protein
MMLSFVHKEAEGIIRLKQRDKPDAAHERFQKSCIGAMS